MDTFGSGLEDQQSMVSRLMDESEEKNYLNNQVHLNYFDLHIEGAQLLSNANLKLTPGHRYGLIGDNGVGKTTLLRHLAAKKIKGMWKEHLTAVLVAQWDPSSKMTLIEALMAFPDMEALEQEVQDHPENDCAVSMLRRVEEVGFEALRSKGFQILHGLGFTHDQASKTLMKELSGGWRVRVALARALLLEPDLLLLDEPTNHLDIPTLVWLDNYLKTYPKTLVIVSHDVETLNEVCTDIIEFKGKQLTQFQGNYDGYLKTISDLLAKQGNLHTLQEQARARYEATIEYLKRKGDPKASKMVSSRNKALERLGAQRTATGRRWKWGTMGYRPVVPKVEEKEELHFKMSSDKRLRELEEGDKVLELEGFMVATYRRKEVETVPGVASSWEDDGDEAEEDGPAYTETPVLRIAPFSASITKVSKIALVGRNGCGKTTLLRAVADKQIASPTFVERVEAGEKTAFIEDIRIGWYQQDNVLMLDAQETPVEYLTRVNPGSKPQEARNHLSSFAIPPPLMELPHKHLSAGQRSRVVLACISFGRPSLLILDEPTNHLDMDSLNALGAALAEYKGPFILVSHSQHLVQACCNTVWVLENDGLGSSTVAPLQDTTFEDWRDKMLEKAEEEAADAQKQPRQKQKQQAKKAAGDPSLPPTSNNPGGAKLVPKDAGGTPGVHKASKVVCRVCKGDHFTHQCEKKKELDKQEAAKEAKHREKQMQREMAKAAAASASTTYDDAEGTWNVVVDKKTLKNLRR